MTEMRDKWLQSVEKSTNQISQKRREVKYDSRDLFVDYLVQKFRDDEFYIPSEYQRHFIWSEFDKCYFIESLLMDLPIPFMFFADTDDGRVEIVDGAQRVQTLAQFVENELELKDLRILTESNGFKFRDLDPAVRRRFLNQSIRVVYLAEGTTTETRQEIFRRINSGGRLLNPPETRRGAFSGPFEKLLQECTENELFNKLAPRTPKTEKRFEGLELVSRFFAYLNNYDHKYSGYTGRVTDYIEQYLEEESLRFKQGCTQELVTEYKREFEAMLYFVERTFGDLGFRKTETSNSTPRARFEALSVGSALALRKCPSLEVSSIDWLDSDEFKHHTRADAANNKGRLIGRIKFVKDALLVGE